YSHKRPTPYKPRYDGAEQDRRRCDRSDGCCMRSVSERRILLAAWRPYCGSFLIASPARTVPQTTTRQFAPRKRTSRPIGELTNFSAFTPNRAENLAQPVCGGSLNSLTAEPS